MSAETPLPTNAFIGKAAPPSDAELAEALGAAKPAWDKLAANLRERLGLDGCEWKSYSIKAGWSLRFIKKKRNIIYLGPRAGCFLAAFILGDKALAAAKEARLPKAILELLNHAERYPEGNGVRILVKHERALPAIEKLAAIKLAN